MTSSTHSTDDGAVAGIDARPVTAWLADRVELSPPLQFEIIAGGHSNLTYRVSDAAGRRWVLRRPPLAHLLAGAHDMVREHRLLSSLEPTEVPTPPVVGLCTDAEVNGADFYVTGFVDGTVLRSLDDAETLTPEARGELSRRMVEVLAAIHSTDLEATGLATLGRPEDYVARQIHVWRRQFNAMTSRDLPIIERVHDVLVASIPPQAEATLVHGDYRLDNCLSTTDGDLAAVLDWEISTLGDPVAELGFLLGYWVEPDDGFNPLGHDATAAEGFWTRDQLAHSYAELTGRDISSIEWHFAFASWRLACILEGVHARYVGGAIPEIPPEVHEFPQSIVSLAERAESVLANL
ncbi:phosphotransferase family protein [Candidatus Poriferisodalis sp.]|uniref:phosphotransferase family protein n=1 Tax=Candidatus Poriferisodalis sp. TaxID=3101277 RepID=UPI003B01E56B